MTGEFQSYFGKFSETVGSYYEEDIKECGKNIESYVSLLNRLGKLTHIRSNEDAFMLVDMMTRLNTLITNIQIKFTYFNPGRHRFTQEFSTTYLMETSAMFDKIIVLIDQTMKKNLSYDFDIIVYLGAKIMSEFSLHTAFDSFKKIRGYYKAYNHSTSLYSYVVQEIVDLMFVGEKETRIDAFKIMNILEKDKNSALGEGFAKPIFLENMNNPSLMSFGLIPVTELMPLADIIHLAFNQSVSLGGEDKPDIKLLHELGVSNNVGIVIYKKITTRPADYDINGLIQKSKLRDTAGINPVLVHKFKTISLLQSNGIYDFKLSSYGMSLDECRNVLIADEITDGKFKIMSPWNKKTYIIPVYEVFDFIEFSKRGGVVKKPARAELYNRVMIHRMMGSMFLDRSVNVKQISEKSQVDEIKFLRNDLFNKLMEHYTNSIETQYSGGRGITCNKDLVKIINDPEVKNVFVEVLIKNYHEFLKKNEMMDNKSGVFVFDEVISTFLAQLHIIIRGFVREIFSNSEIFTPSELLYQKPFLVMYAEVKDIIDKVVRGSLGKVLSDKTNIYQSLTYKTMLLNL